MRTPVPSPGRRTGQGSPSSRQPGAQPDPSPQRPPHPAALVAATSLPGVLPAVSSLSAPPRLTLAQEVGITLVVCMVLLPVGIRAAFARFCPSQARDWRLSGKLSCIPVLLFIIALATTRFVLEEHIPSGNDGSPGIYQLELAGAWLDPLPQEGLTSYLRVGDPELTRIIGEPFYMTNMIPAAHTIRRTNGEIALMLLHMRTGISHAYLDPLSLEREGQLPQCGLYTTNCTWYYTRSETDVVLNSFRLARQRWDAEKGSLPELLAFFPKGWTQPMISPAEAGP